MRNLGIVGVGNMGGGMAGNLLRRGWGGGGHDIDRAKVQALEKFGAIACDSAAEAARAVRLVIVCVVDAEQSRDVLFAAGGATESLGRGGAVMLCPTIAPQDTESIAAELAQRGIATIDAPMSG